MVGRAGKQYIGLGSETNMAGDPGGWLSFVSAGDFPSALIGDGPTVLTKTSGIGSDMALDDGIAMCGKGGQSVLSGVGQPTLLIDASTIGGTA